MSPVELALVSIIAGMGFATIVVLVSMVVDLVKAARTNVRRWGHPLCKVCGDVAAPGDDDYCWRHMHLKSLKQAERQHRAERSRS